MALPAERATIPTIVPRPAASDAPGLRAVPATPARAYAVDALRGLAFLCVVLGGAKPYGVLPAWMYHAQEPPPTHMMDPSVAGLTFPDLVFPAFLFTMGVAIPLALTRRIERGGSFFGILRRGVVTRFLLLMFLALFRQHFDSGAFDHRSPMIHQPQQYAWGLGLLGFVTLFAIFTRFPSTWSKGLQRGIHAAGWLMAIAMFAFTSFPDGTHIRPHQLDDILVINAYCVALATLIWLATRRNLLGRLGIVAFLVVIRLNDGQDGWLNNIYAFQPFEGAYDFAFLQYLCVTIPGTIIGDLFVVWSRAPQFDGARTSLFIPADEPLITREWSSPRVLTVAVLLVLSIPLLLIGIQSRFVFLTTVSFVGLCTVAVQLTRHPGSATETLISQLVRFGSFWLLLGLFLDPVQGGTHKEPPTFAWLFQGCGLAIFILTLFVIVLNVYHHRKSLQLLIDNGQNPMMGYVGYGMLMLPLLGLSGIKNLIESSEPSPWTAFAWSMVVTMMVAFIVQFFTRRKLFWRS
jgi:predicted acyltransferase